MAKAYGGQHSPGAPGRNRTEASRAGGAGFRAWLMFVAPLPLVLRLYANIVTGDPAGILRSAGGFVLLIAGAFLLREGLKAEAAWTASDTARRPAFPRKTFAAALCGLGVAAATWGGIAGPVLPITLGVLAVLLHGFAFGLDPMRDKGEVGLDTLAGRRAAAAIADGEAELKALLDAAARLKDRVLKQRIEGFARTARDMFDAVERDPRDLVSARKYLGIYLSGARAATEKFVALYAETGDMAARADYEALLADLQTNFDAGRREMLLDDRADLDVEIEVLRDRLQAELPNS
jgi:hypothetical protein